MKILIAVSGTGGHIYPALSFAQYCNTRGIEIVFIGNTNALTQKLIKEKQFPLEQINMIGWQKRKIIAGISVFFRFIISTWDVIRLIHKHKPSVVIGMGGYVAFPAIFGAWLMHIPTIIHEQNCYPGLTNRILRFFSSIIALGFSDAAKYFPAKKTITAGNPIREEFFTTQRNTARHAFGISDEQKAIFVFGGSQGAHSINELIAQTLPLLQMRKNEYTFIHITGSQDFEKYKNIYVSQGFSGRVYPYYQDLFMAYHAADCIICRSGASTIAELEASSVPAILIPYPFATDDHQMYNAQYLMHKGSAKTYRETQLTPSLLTAEIQDILNDPKWKKSASAIAEHMRKAKKPEELLYNTIYEKYSYHTL